MAGKQIYTGNMLESMENKISDLQSDMATMSGDMANVVLELINLKSVMSSGITVANVGIGNDYNLILSDVEYTDNTDTTISCFGGTIKANGTVTISGECKMNNVNYSMNVVYRLNSGGWVILKSTNSISYVSFSESITVSDGDYLEIGMSGGWTGLIKSLKDGVALSYSLVDIVNDGVFIAG